MSDLSQRLAALSPAKRALLERQLRKQATSAQTLPLSYAQQRLWLLNQLEPGNASYNMPSAIRFHGELHVSVLMDALAQLVRRHEALRTTFEQRDGLPVQVIAPQVDIPITSIDLHALPAAEREDVVNTLLATEARFIFDLTSGPLLRVTLCQLGAGENVLLLNIHHIIFDGWSFGILLHEWATLYNAGVTSMPAVLPPLPMQYGDYAIWQRSWSQGDTLQRQLAYWREHLRGMPSLLALPADHPRPARQTFRGAMSTAMIEPALVDGLRQLGQEQGATLFMVLLTIFQVLLHRYTGESDLVVGTPIANRNRTEIEGLIGFFVNALALRTDLSGNPGFVDLLARTRAVALDAYANQDVSIDLLLETLAPERSLSYTPLFQVFFNMVNLPDAPAEWLGLTTEIFWPRDPGAKFDLTLYVQETGNSLQLELVYNADLFDEARMQEMLAQYLILASLVVAHPADHIRRYSLVTSSAASRLPDPTLPLSESWEGAVTTLFAEQAQRQPNHPAIISDEGIWSYREVDDHSNRVANWLLAQGIQRGDVVALYAHRSPALIWSVMGILRSGASLLILDPAYPATRIIDYLTRASIRGWLCMQSVSDLPDALATYLDAAPLRARGIITSSMDGAWLRLPTHAPDITLGADDIAFVAFTSGSTGEPKGILQRHGSLSHFLPWQREAFALTSADRYSLLSGLAHDPLQRDIFTSLCLGGTICIPDAEAMSVLGALARWMYKQQISFGNFTPALLQILTQPIDDLAETDVQVPSLRYAMTIGDVLARRDVARLRRLAPAVTCVNLYGSTETQRALGYYIVPPAVADGDTSHEKEIMPLGQGMPDVQLLVLNESGMLAGIGEIGEIHVRSPHLARGYLNHEALTRERFIINPWTGQPADRLYRTGDLGRYRPDGVVEPAGRNDQQVKIRGFRIELGEIEAVLGRHPAVHEAVVVMREDQPQNKYLVAYIVPRTTGGITLIGELRRYAQEQLPSYMVPAAFMTLDALPLTPNRKVDRAHLPAPELAGPETQYVAPGTPVEEQLASIWMQVLGCGAVGIYDNFFELGGHSLLAVQIAARVRTTLGKEISLRTIFESPTIAMLAQVIEQRQDDVAASRPNLVAHAREVNAPAPEGTT